MNQDKENAAFDAWLYKERAAGCIGDMQRGWMARAAQDDGWQPIETAPRYRRLLVWVPEIGQCVASAGWDNETPEIIKWGVVNDIYVNPTHWRPLPAPPAKSGK